MGDRSSALRRTSLSEGSSRRQVPRSTLAPHKCACFFSGRSFSSSAFPTHTFTRQDFFSYYVIVQCFSLGCGMQTGCISIPPIYIPPICLSFSLPCFRSCCRARALSARTLRGEKATRSTPVIRMGGACGTRLFRPSTSAVDNSRCLQLARLSAPMNNTPSRKSV